MYHLKRVEHFNGNNYNTPASASAPIAGGALVTVMESQHGVVMKVRTTRQGLQFIAALEGVAVELKQ